MIFLAQYVLPAALGPNPAIKRAFPFVKSKGVKSNNSLSFSHSPVIGLLLGLLYENFNGCCPSVISMVLFDKNLNIYAVE